MYYFFHFTAIISTMITGCNGTKASFTILLEYKWASITVNSSTLWVPNVIQADKKDQCYSGTT